MKKLLTVPFNLMSTCFIVLVLFASSATAQILFEDNFAKANRTAEKWAFLQGGWEVKGGELTQNNPEGRTIAVVSDAFWDDTWNEYIFELTARKLRGANGARIFWRINDDLQPGPGRDDARSFTLDGPVKGRLADEKATSSFGGKSVGKTAPPLSFEMLGELRISRRARRQSISSEGSRCISKL